MTVPRYASVPKADGDHVAEKEAQDALDPSIGAGAPGAAPVEVPDAARGRYFDPKLLLGALLAGLSGAVALLATDHTTTGILVAVASLLGSAGAALLKS